MLGSVRGYIEHYFAPHPSQEMRHLFLSTALLNFATSAISLFEPLYLHSDAVGFTIPQILLFYGAVYLLYIFLLPLGGRICRRHGYEHTILYSSPFLILWYVSLFAIQWNKAFIPVAILSLVMQKILYWPGYHANFTAWGKKAEQGREVSNMTAIVGLMAVVAPAVGGAVIASFGYVTLFVGVAILILLSNIPLLQTPERLEPRGFDYVEAIKRPFRKKQRRSSLAFFGFGEEFIAMVAWPIFMAISIPNLTSLGLVVSLAMLINIGAVLWVGRISDEGDRGAVLRSGVFYDIASWLVRPFVAAGGLGVFLMDTFYRVSKHMLGVPLVTAVYDEARDGDSMETIIHFEMSLAAGKLSAAVLAALILVAWPNGWTGVFVLAAGFAALYSFASQPSKKNVAAIPLPVIQPTNEPL